MIIKKIIIIDDDIEYTNEMEELLVQMDFEIIKKNNTHDILNFIKKTKPDLIILDLKINGKTGIDVAKLVKNDPKTNGLPIILLSNYYNGNYSDYNRDIIKFGINICLKKTINPETLFSEIKKIESG
jgi:response regulator RpfG family c-di-GMP phosphodiesterase